MTNNWEVLLKRDNGFNRTVIIEDCMYESEAAEVAESMYGMEVLRVLWKGKTDTSTEDNVNWFVQRRPNYQGLLGLCLTLPIIMGIVIAAEFWLPILIVLTGVSTLSWFGSFRRDEVEYEDDD
tara:strand:- start:833 stop:1201 length:369 start_codon:yes stop_codon:yes gene_type:complete